MAIPIQKAAPTPAKTKMVEPTQKALDALALNSGTWKVRDIRGLYVRCRARTKSFMLGRRIDGHLNRLILGELTMAQAKDAAVKQWSVAANQPRESKVLTLGDAIEDYIQAKVAAGKLRPKSVKMMRYNATHYLADWTNRTLDEIGTGRLEIRHLQQRLVRQNGPATSNQCMRLLSAVYTWCRGVIDLPEWPKKAAEIVSIPPRDSAMSADEIRHWWRHDADVDGKVVHRGVSTLTLLKKTWWCTVLLTGARAGSVEALRWEDVDLERKVLKFSTAKAGRVYSVPMADALARLLTNYKSNPDTLPGEWVFASPLRAGAHIVEAKSNREGVKKGPHALRHTFRTTLVELGATEDEAKLLMGHSLGGVSGGYVSSALLVEPLRPLANKIAHHYLKIVPGVG